MRKKEGEPFREFGGVEGRRSEARVLLITKGVNSCKDAVLISYEFGFISYKSIDANLSWIAL